MSYRVQQDGTIETDTAEEALALFQLIVGLQPGDAAGQKKHGVRRGRGKPKTRGRTRRPMGAVEHNIKVGQVYEHHKGGSSPGRVIQIDKLFQSGVLPKIVKESPKSKRKGTVKQISYHHLCSAYKLIKDV